MGTRFIPKTINRVEKSDLKTSRKPFSASLRADSYGKLRFLLVLYRSWLVSLVLLLTSLCACTRHLRITHYVQYIEMRSGETKVMVPETQFALTVLEIREPTKECVLRATIPGQEAEDTVKLGECMEAPFLGPRAVQLTSLTENNVVLAMGGVHYSGSGVRHR